VRPETALYLYSNDHRCLRQRLLLNRPSALMEFNSQNLVVYGKIWPHEKTWPNEPR
jgi:hypothetical protein